MKRKSIAEIRKENMKRQARALVLENKSFVYDGLIITPLSDRCSFQENLKNETVKTLYYTPGNEL